jgi:hypothetical protein
MFFYLIRAIPGFGRLTFTDYAPLAFKCIRDRFGFTSNDLMKSLDLPSIVEMSLGKSASGEQQNLWYQPYFFFNFIFTYIVFIFTSDKRFIFKTLRGSEPENLKSFLPDVMCYQ